jgi:hypothetical protein
MAGEAIDEVLGRMLARLDAAAIEQDPFPHIVIEDALPPDVFSSLVTVLLSEVAFAPAEYPGTGAFTSRHGGIPTAAQGSRHHGLVLRNWSTNPLLRRLRECFAADAFSRALLNTFARPGSRGAEGCAIPVEKCAWFSGPHRNYTCTFACNKDLEHYEISPHVDNPAKLVTFLLYVDDDWERPCGTLLCRRRQGSPTTPASDRSYESARHAGRSGLWMDWDDFEVVKTIAGPNVLFAFAPNDISYHAVRFNADVTKPTLRARTVIRGFVARKGYRDTRLLQRDDERQPASGVTRGVG